jgi:hypothetical protein
VGVFVGHSAFYGSDGASSRKDKAMPRYILIGNCSNYIFGDTALLPNVPISTSDGYKMTQSDIASPVDAARWLDETETQVFDRTYEMVSRSELASNETGYHVYRADINGSDAVQAIDDGQNQELIEDVERNCEYVTSIRCITGEV